MALPFEQRPLLSVRAVATRPVEPDTASLALSVQVTGQRAEEVGPAALARAAAIVAAVEPVPLPARVSTEDVRVRALETEQLSLDDVEDWRPRRLAYRASVRVKVDDLTPTQASGLLLRGLAAGATSASLGLQHRDCTVLGELRVEAVERAHRRARIAAEGAGVSLGALYRIKELAAECPPKGDDLAVHIVLSASDDGSTAEKTLDQAGLEGLVLQARLQASVEVLAVYGIETREPAPPDETPGEAHLGLSRSQAVASIEARAAIELRARVVGDDPSSGHEEARARMARVIVALREAGLRPDELGAGRVRVVTLTRKVDQEGHRHRVVSGYLAEASIELQTTRFEQLGHFIAVAARQGATGVKGPFYSLVDPQAHYDVALRAATRAAVEDARALATAGGRSVRTATQVRATGGWISKDDVLRELIDNLGQYRGGFRGRSVSTRYQSDDFSPDAQFPTITIRPPALEVEASVAVGFALGKQ
ncbi:MAG: SIMPL domain-containing protein [Myxococcales bacterium]|nr:SIMPL domain-containing protein [Myxococcales bacterium]